ncbi:MAG: hydroxylase [bacterium]|nr:hydroxylase [bacterium]
MIRIDTEKAIVEVETASGVQTFPMDSPEAFAAVSDAWLRCGWDNKYVYSFTWMGRPIIQMPEDLLRIQEVIYTVKPDVIVETGVAHGGSAIFYASLFRAIGKGRVIGIDIEIRPHNRKAIEEHELFDAITLIEGSSIDASIVERVKRELGPDEKVLVILDSKHTKDHVLAELEAYAPMASVGSYVVVQDGCMEWAAGAPRSEDDWSWNNPVQAIKEFTAGNSSFEVSEPPFAFNEGNVTRRITYWPEGYLRRIR